MRLFGLRRLSVFAMSLSLVAALAACGANDDITREDVVTSLADNVYVPAYRSAADSSASMTAALEAFQASPSVDTLNAARDAWKEARLAWSRTLSFEFGPAEDRRTMSLVDWMPLEPDKIDETIEARDSFDVEYVVEFLGGPQRGLGAIEHVLFSDDDDETHLAAMQADGGKRIEFAVAVSQSISEELATVSKAWSEGLDGDDPYRDVFSGHAPVSIFVNSAIAESVRGPVFLMQTVADMQIEPAAGMDGGEEDLSGLPSRPSGYTWPDIRSRIEGARDVYTGVNDEPGLSALVAQLSDDTDRRMRDAFAELVAALDAPDDIDSVVEKLNAARRIFNTEVVSLLGVTVGFSDNDGDTSN